MKIDGEAASAELEFRLRTEFSHPNVLRAETVVLRKGPKAYRTATVMTFGDKATREVKGRQMQLRSYNARATGPGFAFDQAPSKWTCYGDEIEKLRVLLEQELPKTGRYKLLTGAPEFDNLLTEIASGQVAPAAVMKLLVAMKDAPGLEEAVTASPDAELLAGLVEVSRQRRGIAELRAAVDKPESLEAAFQAVLRRHWRLFGGRYVGQATRRKIALLDEIDLPLIRSDGVLHVVELKRANVPGLVVAHRNHPIVGKEVHAAVGQAMNYLRSLDEQRAAIKLELGIDCRRAFATVVIGHPRYVSNYSDDDVSETIRTYNSHLSRIEVITYKDLIDGAELVLAPDDE